MKEDFDKECMPTEEKKAELLKKGVAVGKPQIKADETMTFDYFL